MQSSNAAAADRRSFLRQAGTGVGLAAAWTGIAGKATASLTHKPKQDRLPREVWVASISQNKLSGRDAPTRVAQVLARMEEVVPLEPDIICLPEAFSVASLGGTEPPAPELFEEPIGHLSSPFAEFARKHHCYVVCPVITKHENRYYNTALFIDRQGKLLGEYHKTHPTNSEMNMSISSGPLDPPVFKTDFGVVGAQICYDVQWPEGWQKLQQAGAEIVFWPSAFGGGRMLNAKAWEHQYCVVSSTRKNVSKICDISGEEVASTSFWNHWVCAPVNLEKTIVPIWPYVRNLEDIRAKYGRSVRATTFAEEGWLILESRSADLKIADILKEFDLQTLTEALSSVENAQCACRL